MKSFEIVGENIKNELKRQGMTQADLAKILDVSRQSVTQALGRNIEIAMLFRIAAALRVDAADLVKTGERGTTIEERKLRLLGIILRITDEGELRTLEEVVDQLPIASKLGAAGSAG